MQRSFRLITAVCLAATLFAATLLIAGKGDRAGASSPPAWTAASLTALIATSLQQSAVPAALDPDLATAIPIAPPGASLNAYVARESHCDALRHPKFALAPQACFYGATRSKRTLVVFGGGSNLAWTWALNAPLRHRGIRLAMFEFSGCPSADVTATPSLFPEAWQNCNTWHARLPKAIAALRPFAVVTSSGAYEAPTTDAEWVADYAKAIHAVSARLHKAKMVLIGSSPILTGYAPMCVDAHQADLQTCTFLESTIIDDHKTSNGYNGEPFTQILARDHDVAAAAHARLVPAEPWLCLNGKCPLVFGDYLAYRDDRHFFFPFLEALGPVVDHALHVAGVY